MKAGSQANLRIDPYNPFDRQSRANGFDTQSSMYQPSISRNPSLTENIRPQTILNSNIEYPSEINRGNINLKFLLTKSSNDDFFVKIRNILDVSSRLLKTSLFSSSAS